MVYALEEIHRLLKPGGTLIELHPSLEPPPSVEVRASGRRSFSEVEPAFDYDVDDLRRAERAVATAVDGGVFTRDGQRRFELRTHASSVEELRDYWVVYGAYDAEEKGETLLRRQDEMYARVQDVVQRAPGAEIVYVEPATMSRLTPRG